MTVTDPLVSVVTPVYNASPHLREAVESVLAQTYEPWELLLVDDGSTDGSAEIARAFAEQFPDRIRYLEHPGRENRGCSASRNRGIAAARGEILANLDADDVWLPGKLERHVPLLCAEPNAGLLLADAVYWYSWSGDPADAERDHSPSVGAPTGRSRDGRSLLREQLEGTIESPCTCSVLARLELVRRVGGFENQFRGMHEDQVFYAKMLLAAPAVVARGGLARYRCYSAAAGSVTSLHAQPGARNAARLTYLDWLASYLADHARDEVELRHIVESAQRTLRDGQHHAWRRFGRRSVRRIGRVVQGVLNAGRASVGIGTPPPGMVRFGHLRHTSPINRHWGWERGQPVDRHYIEAFLARHAADVRGRVLEVGDDSYTRRFGGDRVAHHDVLHAFAGNPAATVIADLADADHIPSDRFDCIILTQTLHLVFDVHAAMRTLYRVLAPGGTLLLTVPGISQTTDDSWRDSWYWSLTVPALMRLARNSFPADGVEVTSYGNVLTAVAFLHGLARDELRPDELAATDPDFPLVVTLRARKTAS